MKRLISILLIAEGAVSGFWISTLLTQLRAFDLSVDLLLALRALVATAEVGAAIALRGDRPLAARLTQGAVIASATLRIFETGLGIAPSDLTPSLRWPVVGACALYALVLSWLVGRPSKSRGAEAPKRPLGLG